MMKTTTCSICHAIVADIEGPVYKHTYLPQSPGCWKLYTDVLTREYGEWEHPGINRLTVDSYAAQHPTKEPDQKSAQSVTVHLVGIYLYLEKERDPAYITAQIKKIVEKNKGNFQWLPPPDDLGPITVADVHGAQNLEEHTERVKRWGHSVWKAWENYHDNIRAIASSTK